MSYRTYVNGHQLFGNNEAFPEWHEFLLSQGVEIDDEGNYDGEIHDFMAALIVMENIVERLQKQRISNKEKLNNEIKEKNLSEEEREYLLNHIYGVKSLFDLNFLYDDWQKQKGEDFCFSLFDHLQEAIDSAYMFLPCQLYMACKDKLQKSSKCFATPGHFSCYELKEGETISVSAS